jgi:type VI secretion system protein ImpJ
MTVRAVHWHEGMFLRPHHFQAAQRYESHRANLGEKWDQHYNWGLRDVDIDTEALANFRLVVRALKARLRDGTLVQVPEDGNLPMVDMKPSFERGTSVTAFLGVPVAHVGKANVAANGSNDGSRYLLDTQDLEDENTGINPQPIQVRLLNLRLLLSTDDHAGYEVVPIVKLEKSAQGAPQVDVTYIPPILACDGWKVLATDVLQETYHRMGRRIELLASMVSKGISFGSQEQRDQEILGRLRVLNEAYALFGVIAFAQGVHPLAAYLEMCRLVGQLAIYGQERRPAELPHYDHDDLGYCFYAAKKYVDALMYMPEEDWYKERPFKGAGLQMQVTVERDWLESAWDMYVGVQSKLKPEDLSKLLKGAGAWGLNMKIGSSDRAEYIYTTGQRGLVFNYSPQPPRVLPSPPGLTYFQVERASELKEWQFVQKSYTLAMRFSEKLIHGEIEGEHELTIRLPNGQTTKLGFTLYVVRRQADAGAAPATS